jgi:hypothetical protein
MAVIQFYKKGRFDHVSYDTVQTRIEYLPGTLSARVSRRQKREPNPSPRPSFVRDCIVKAQIYNFQ